MVLKALFVGSRLAPVVGLMERANPELARILVDFAGERWAAGRAITPEIWRNVGPFAEGDMLDDLKRVAESEDPREREAAALALSTNPSAEAKAVLEGLGPELASIEVGQVRWENVVREPDTEEAVS